MLHLVLELVFDALVVGVVVGGLDLFGLTLMHRQDPRRGVVRGLDGESGRVESVLKGMSRYFFAVRLWSSTTSSLSFETIKLKTLINMTRKTTWM